MTTPTPLPRVVSLTGVYNADGGFWGESTYLIGKLRGTAHCSLCDTTHSGVRRRKQWDEMCGMLPVPFDLVHRNERSPAVAHATGNETPVVCAHVDDGDGIERIVTVMGAVELGAVAGDVARFRAALLEFVASHGLTMSADQFTSAPPATTDSRADDQ